MAATSEGMSGTFSQASKQVDLSLDVQARNLTEFPIAFKIGPYDLFRTNVELTVVDCDGHIFAGRDTNLATYSDQNYFLRAVPDRGLGLETDSDDRYLRYVFYRYERSWVTLEGDFDTYFRAFSKKSRKNLRRRIKNLREASGGGNDVRHYRTADELAAFYPLAREVSEKTFQEKLVGAGLPEDGSFYDRMQERARQGRCHGSMFFIHDKPISFLYCEQDEPRLIAKYGGFDPEYAKLSPGTVYLCHLLEELFETKSCRFFDFGPGKSEYKEFFATDRQPCADILILEKNPRNWIVVGTHKALALLTSSMLKTADVLRLKQRFRQRFRGR